MKEEKNQVTKQKAEDEHKRRELENEREEIEKGAAEQATKAAASGGANAVDTAMVGVSDLPVSG